MLRDPAKRDPRGYIVPSNQPDFPTATKFINTLRHVGVTVMRATSPFTVNGKTYPAGSFVVKTAQAFRPYVLDMFEPQDHPNDFAYPGGPPKRPYDNAGWTLAYQMGVQFDRVLDGFDGPFDKVDGLAPVPLGTVAGANGAAGYVFSHQQNDAFTAINRLLKAGEDVFIARHKQCGNIDQRERKDISGWLVLRRREGVDAAASPEGGDGSGRKLRRNRDASGR